MRIAMITGASSGMGWEMARQIDEQFQNLDEIWLIARRVERLESLSTLIRKKVRIFSLDLSERGQIFELERQLFVARANVKLLVNAAGFGKIGPVGEVSSKDELDMVRVNCEALTGVTHIALPFMQEQARIIQFASSAAFLPQPNFAIYAATKSFVLSYSRALAAELLDRKIFVTCVCPGPVKTEFFDVAEAYHKTSFIKRLSMAKPEKVVALAIEDCRKGKVLSIYGIPMKTIHVISKVLPHSFVIRIMKMLT